LLLARYKKQNGLGKRWKSERPRSGSYIACLLSVEFFVALFRSAPVGLAVLWKLRTGFDQEFRKKS